MLIQNLTVHTDFNTYLGGSNDDIGHSITVLVIVAAILLVKLNLKIFTRLNAYNSTYGGKGDAFFAKFATNGSLLWSTYLGGSSIDVGDDIAVTNDGSCYVTGNTYSNNFPTKHAFDKTFNGGMDVFVTKFNNTTEHRVSPYYGFLAFIVIIPVIVFIVLKKRK